MLHAVLIALFSLKVSLSFAFEIPPLTQPVEDMAQLMDTTSRETLNRSLKAYRTAHGPHIQILTVRTLDGMSIEDAAMKVVEAWKIGDATRDDGVLLLIAVDDRTARIEVGGGLEGQLTDAKAAQIIRTILVPYFKQGMFSDGVIVTSQHIAQTLGGSLDIYAKSRQQRPMRKVKSLSLFEIIVFILIMIVITIFRGGRRAARFGRRWGGGRSGGWSSSGGSWGGGGGGWSGGGGGFSGGGASGRW